jgi:hypothetical protein
MSIEPLIMTCDWCKSEFPADPRACCEAGVSADHDISEDENIDDETKLMLMKEFGLDEEELHTLLTTGHVEGLGAIICLKCQFDAAEENRLP